MTERRALAAILLAVPGVLAAHWVAYAAVDPSGIFEGSHGYLGSTAALGAPAALLGFVALAVSGVRAARLDRLPSGFALVLLQMVLFGVQELAELLSAGGAPLELLGRPVFWTGLALQIPLALVLLGVASLGRRLLSALLGGDPPDPNPRPAAVLGIVDVWSARPPASPCSLRGPPVPVR